MARVSPVVIALTCLAPVSLGADQVLVELNPAGLRVQVERAPAAAVLEELSRQTGTVVTYDGPPPETLVSLSFQAADPIDAFIRTIEGLGVSYAAAIDPRAGTLKSVLLVTTPGTPPPVAAASAAAAGLGGRGAGSVVANPDELPEGYSEIARRPVRRPENMSPPPEQNEVEREMDRPRPDWAGRRRGEGENGEAAERRGRLGRGDGASQPRVNRPDPTQRPGFRRRQE